MIYRNVQRYNLFYLVYKSIGKYSHNKYFLNLNNYLKKINEH